MSVNTEREENYKHKSVLLVCQKAKSKLHVFCVIWNKVVGVSAVWVGAPVGENSGPPPFPTPSAHRGFPRYPRWPVRPCLHLPQTTPTPDYTYPRLHLPKSDLNCPVQRLCLFAENNLLKRFVCSQTFSVNSKQTKNICEGLPLFAILNAPLMWSWSSTDLFHAYATLLCIRSVFVHTQSFSAYATF